MIVYTARQPIFNRKLHVTAYELLFRDGEENRFPNVDPHHATAKMLMRTHLNGGLSVVTDGKPALINFTEDCLMSGFPELLPSDQVMIEVLETVPPTDEVYNKCRELFHKGYALALDDFQYSPEWERFFKFIKVIKFDIQATPLKKIKPLVDILAVKYPKLKLLAERVETNEEYEEAKSMGFRFFQGYFFCKPEMHKTKDVQSDEGLLITLYQELMNPELDIPRVSACFEQDVGLTYKLLNYINSGILPLRNEISSIRAALIYLGEDQIRKLLTLLTTATFALNKPKEVIRVAITRARACELVAKKVSPDVANEAFLVGLLSQIPAILDRPMEDILEKLPVSSSIKEALLKERSPSVLRTIFNAVRLYEVGNWHLTRFECQKLSLEYDNLGEFMLEAMGWAQRFDKVIDNKIVT